MKKIEVKSLNLELVSKSPVLDIKYDKSNERLIFDIDQQELSHKYLKDTGGDPHPQYLDMIRHRGMDHTFLTEYFDKLYLHKHPKPIQYFFERYDVAIEPGCFAYTILPLESMHISNIAVASRKQPIKLILDIHYNGQSILMSPITEDGTTTNINGSYIHVYDCRDLAGLEQIFGGLLEVIIIDAEDVEDLLFRIEFK